MCSVAWDPKSPHQLKLAYHPHVLMDCCPSHHANNYQLTSIDLLRALRENDCLFGSLGVRNYSSFILDKILLPWAFILEPHGDAVEVSELPRK